MAIENRNLEINDGGLWEMGVAVPLSNMDMARFEQQLVLAQDATSPTNVIYLPGHSERIKPGSRIYIGPSSDPTRNELGNLLYFGNYEVFKVEAVTADGDNDRIDLDPLVEGYSDQLQNNYVAGDPVSFRGIAEGWEYLAEDQFAGINSIDDPRQDTTFDYAREDSLDEYKGFSQGIATDAALAEPVDVGISQALTGQKANVLQHLRNKVMMVSAWVRVQSAYLIPVVTDQSIVTPYVICSFYEHPDALKPNRIINFTYVFGTTQIPERYWNVQIADRVLVPPAPVSMRLGAYGTFAINTDEHPLRLHIDDVIAEHCAETSQETNGRYVVDINPSIGVSTNNASKSSTTVDPSGITRSLKTGDPTLKLRIEAMWKNRPSYFINDMKKLEYWNRQGFPIVLRPKMPGTLPDVLFCNISTDVSYFHTASNARGDVKVSFEEVSV